MYVDAVKSSKSDYAEALKFAESASSASTGTFIALLLSGGAAFYFLKQALDDHAEEGPGGSGKGGQAPRRRHRPAAGVGPEAVIDGLGVEPIVRGRNSKPEQPRRLHKEFVCASLTSSPSSRDRIRYDFKL